MSSTPAARNGHRDHSNGRSPAPSEAETLDARALLKVLRAVRRGDFDARLETGTVGAAGEAADALNEIIEINQRLARELDRISRVVGK